MFTPYCPNSTGFNILFDWAEEYPTWAGHTKKEIVDLIDRAANVFNISPEYRNVTDIYFGDYDTYSAMGKEKPLYAASNPVQFYNTHIQRGRITLNRSLEGLEERFKKSAIPQNSTEGYAFVDNEIHIQLIEPWEGLTWLISEELNHTGFGSKYRSESEVEIAVLTYLFEMSTYHHKTLDLALVSNYTFNLIETEVSRDVLGLLSQLAAEKSKPERAIFFNDMLKLSIKKKKAVTTDLSRIYTDLFVKFN
jgi:hypothetical protein